MVQGGKEGPGYQESEPEKLWQHFWGVEDRREFWWRKRRHKLHCSLASCGLVHTLSGICLQVSHFDSVPIREHCKKAWSPLLVVFGDEHSTHSHQPSPTLQVWFSAAAATMEGSC